MIRGLALSAPPLQPPERGEGLEVAFNHLGQRFNQFCPRNENCLYNKKPLNNGVRRMSKLVNTSKVLGGLCAWRGHGRSAPTHPYLTPYSSWTWLLLSCILYSRLGIVSQLFSWVLQAILANYRTWRRGHGNPWFIACRSEAQAVT